MTGCQPGVAHGHQPLAVHARDGAAQAAPAAEVDVDVDGARRGVAGLEAGGGERLGVADEGVEQPPAEAAGREHAAAPLALLDGVDRQPGEQVAQHPVADAPLLQRVELDGQRVVEVVLLLRQGQVEPAAHEATHRVAEEGEELVEPDVGDLVRRAAGRRGRPAADAVARRRPWRRRGRPGRR